MGVVVQGKKGKALNGSIWENGDGFLWRGSPTSSGFANRQ